MSVVGCVSNNLPLCAASQTREHALQCGPFSATPSDDLDLWEWEDHPSTFSEELGLTLKDTFLEVPGQHKKIVRLHVTRLGFGNDRDVCTRGKCTKLI